MELQKLIEKKIEDLKELGVYSKEKYKGTRNDVSFLTEIKINTLQEVLNEWQENSFSDERLKNWKEHDDIDPITGDYYFESYKKKVGLL